MKTARPSGRRETPAPPAAMDATRSAGATSVFSAIPQAGAAAGLAPATGSRGGRNGRLAIPPRLVLRECRGHGDHPLHVAVLGRRKEVLTPVEELDVHLARAERRVAHQT